MLSHVAKHIAKNNIFISEQHGFKFKLSQPLTHSSSLHHVAHEATARVLHLASSAAALGAMSRLSLLILKSLSTVYRHVSLGHPLFLLP